MTDGMNIGDGIRLTKVGPDDAVELFQLVARNRDYLREWMPWSDKTKTVNDTLAFVERSQKQDLDGRGFQCCIRLAGTGIVGVAGHVNINHSDRKTELGYWISRECQGRGIATNVVRALVNEAFSKLNLHRIEIRAGESNRRSRGVAERVGFRFEGVIRESEWVNDHFVSHAVYGLLRHEWREHQ